MPRNIEFQNSILDSLTEGIITLDKDFNIIFINHSAEKITGLTRSGVLGKKCFEICKSASCKIDCPIVRVLKSNNPVTDFDSFIYNKSGNTIPIRLNASMLLNSRKQPIGGIISFRKILSAIRSNHYLHNEQNFYGIIGRSEPMMEIFALIKEISQSSAPILIQGETGVGKEMIANAIHKTSVRRDYPFLKVNCSVLPEQLLASELFGHVRGAFTDARSDRLGRFELAHRGTIFLDEISEISIHMQAQLLRVLQDGTFERLGESKTRKTNVRVIAATNVDINHAIKTGAFRSDLFYRLNVIPIYVPPLRERLDDLPILINHFIHKYAAMYKRNISDIETDALNLLMQHDWPGNIRELENVIEFSCIRSRKERSICLCGLPAYLRKGINCFEDQKDKITISHYKSEQLIHLLEKYNWNQTRVAKILGVNRTTVWRRLKSLGIL